MAHKSLNSFAFDNNIEPAILSRVETLKQDIKLSVIEKIANAYGMKISDLMKEYESLNLIPSEQKVQRVIDRAWYVASQIENGLSAGEANKKFRSEKIAIDSTPLEIHAGLNLTKFETKLMKEGINADVYVDKDNKLSVELRADGKKIKTNLRLPAKEVTYLRYIIDSNFIPVTGVVEKSNKGFKIKVEIGK